MSRMNWGRPQLRRQGRQTEDYREGERKWKEQDWRQPTPARKPEQLSLPMPNAKLSSDSAFAGLDPRDPHDQLPGVDMNRPPW